MPVLWRNRPRPGTWPACWGDSLRKDPDPRCGVRVVLHLQDGDDLREGDESSRESVMGRIVHRSEPHEMARVDWPLVVTDREASVPAHRLHGVLRDVVHHVVDAAAAQGFAVAEVELMDAVDGILAPPPPPRVVDHLTTKALQVLWTVHRGGGAWDARQVDLQLGMRGGDVEGGVMPELRYLESRGLVVRSTDCRVPRWSILPGGERLVGVHDHLPRHPGSPGNQPR